MRLSDLHWWSDLVNLSPFQGSSFYETLIVCNYAVGGNLIGKQQIKQKKQSVILLHVQDLRCTELGRPVLTVHLDTLVMTASVPSSAK